MPLAAVGREAAAVERVEAPRENDTEGFAVEGLIAYDAVVPTLHLTSHDVLTDLLGQRRRDRCRQSCLGGRPCRDVRDTLLVPQVAPPLNVASHLPRNPPFVVGNWSCLTCANLGGTQVQQSRVLPRVTDARKGHHAPLLTHRCHHCDDAITLVLGVLHQVAKRGLGDTLGVLCDQDLAISGDDLGGRLGQETLQLGDACPESVAVGGRRRRGGRTCVRTCRGGDVGSTTHRGGNRRLLVPCDPPRREGGAIPPGLIANETNKGLLGLRRVDGDVVGDGRRDDVSGADCDRHAISEPRGSDVGVVALVQCDHVVRQHTLAAAKKGRP